MAIEDLALLVKERRSRDRLSLRAAAQEADVSFNTLARIERGHIPDTENLMKVIAWLEVPPDQIIGPRELRTEATLEIVARHLRADPALSPEAAERIASFVRDLYESVARPRVPTAVHLRAARTFVPEAGRLLSEILVEMDRALTKQP